MNLHEAIPQHRHKDHVHRVATYIGQDPNRFDVLMEYFFEGEEVSDRAAWILSHCMDAHPEMLEPYVKKLTHYLTSPDRTDAVLRNGLRSLALWESKGISRSLDGKLVHFCFELLADPVRPVAIRVHAMELLYHACSVEPDLAEELKETILAHYEHGTPGFKSRGAKILKRLEKL